MLVQLVPTGHPAIASGREPEGGYARNSPLPAVAVSAQDQINSVMRLDIVEDIGRMGQEQRKAMAGAGRDTSKVGAMKRRIIDADDCQFSLSGRYDGALIYQQRDLVSVGEFGILCDRHSAVMIVIA